MDGPGAFHHLLLVHHFDQVLPADNCVLGLAAPVENHQQRN